MRRKKILQWPGGRLDFSAGCIMMGVLNVTPDSFSDGGLYLHPTKAVEHGIKMARQGAALIDVGAESTRPGAKTVPAELQIKRAIPIIKKLKQNIDVPVSIDTYNPHVAEAALDAGASIINDITALGNHKSADLAAKRNIPVILMHMQGTPQTMQIKPEYDNVVNDILNFLLQRAQKARRTGIPRERIFIDPGIGFGKTLEHNLLLLKNIHKFVATPYRVLIGTSRKSFIGKITGQKNPADRLWGTAATVALSAAAGVSIVRVHDIPQMAEILKITNAIYYGKNTEIKGL